MDTFRAYVMDLANPISAELFFEACEKGYLDILLQRSIYITRAMKQRVPAEKMNDVEQYMKDWHLWIKAPYLKQKSELKQFENADYFRKINDETAYDRLLPYTQKLVDASMGIAHTEEEDEDEDEEDFYNIYDVHSEPPQDESKMIDGRLRWYQQRPGSLYCGLYAVQHILNSTEKIVQSDLDLLARGGALEDVDMDNETKQQIITYDYVDPNGNYNVRTLTSALHHCGYVTQVKYQTSEDEIEQYRVLSGIVGIIANRGGGHWYAYRPVGEQWEHCDSMRTLGSFPMDTSQQVATAPGVGTWIIVIQPPELPEGMTWVDQTKSARLRWLFWQLANPDDS